MKHNFAVTLMGVFMVLFALFGINILVWADLSPLNIHVATACLWTAGVIAVLWAAMVWVEYKLR